ncbi:MAG: superoxide dismutase family protein [Actinomycetota bacterium]|nr:superoxide dismutase family protein [Actinomycetota bacterium]
MNKTVLGIAGGSALVVGLITATIADADNHSASATLATAEGLEIGTVEFTTEDGHTEVRVTLEGAPGVDAFHGFHIHANDDDTATPGNGDGCIATDDPATSFLSADGHYNPTDETHSHHVGDMPVVYVNADGSVETRFRLDGIVPGELDGKVVILHANPDNFANIPLGTEATQYTAGAEAEAATAKTGNAGPRVACGVISS